MPMALGAQWGFIFTISPLAAFASISILWPLTYRPSAFREVFVARRGRQQQG